MGYLPISPVLAIWLSGILAFIGLVVLILLCSMFTEDKKSKRIPIDDLHKQKKEARIAGLVCGVLLLNVGTAIPPYVQHANEQADLDALAVLLASPSIEPEQLLEAVQSGRRKLQIVAADHPNLPYEGFVFIAKEGHYQAKMEVAARIDAPPEALVFLSYDDDKLIRQKAKTNSSFPAGNINKEVAERIMELNS